MAKEFIEKCNEWLSQPAAERDVNVGATLMLQANRNRILFQNMIRKPNLDKIEYEIRKYIKSQNLQVEEVKNETDYKELQQKEIEEVLAKAESFGKRTDHELLPDEIKEIPEINTQIYHEMRSIHEKLKLLSEPDNGPGTREDLMNELLKRNDQIRENWDIYDTFVVGSNQNPPADNTKSTGSLTVQEVQKHRTYLSRAVKEVPDKIAKGKIESAEQQKQQAQERFLILIKDGQNIDPEMIENLKSIGIAVDEN